jgi:hypothetical protein
MTLLHLFMIDTPFNAILTNDRFRDLDLRTALGEGRYYSPLSGSLNGTT